MAPQHSSGKPGFRKVPLRLTAALLTCLGAAPAVAQVPAQLPGTPPPAQVAPLTVAPAPVYTLADCVRVGLERQPTLAASRTAPPPPKRSARPWTNSASPDSSAVNCPTVASKRPSALPSPRLG